MTHQLRLLCCAILLQAVSCLTRHSTNATFVPITKCPIKHSELQQQSAASNIMCAGVCSKNPNCRIFHFNRTQKLCYQGNTSCSGLTLWSDGPCTSYREDASVRAEERNVSEGREVAEQLSLKLLYRFTTHGLVNLADPGNNTLRENNVCVNSDGAHFDGSSQSFLITETPGFENFIDYGHSYSVYVQARYNTSVTGVHYYSFKRFESGGMRNGLYQTGRRLGAYSFWTEPSEKLYSYSPFAIPKVEMAQVAAGVSFNGTWHHSFYCNGTELPIDYSKPIEPVAAATDYRLLQIKLQSDTEAAHVHGSMSCFALSTRLLTSNEYQGLQNWCLQLL